MDRTPQLVVVSNRLPVTIRAQAGRPQVQPSTGGLVTALAPLLETLPSTWIGSTGTDYSPEVASAIAQKCTKHNMVPVYLTDLEREEYYQGFSNQVLWPLCHDMQTKCRYDGVFWSTYQKVNEKFADVVTRNSSPGDLIWVHDYHLMLVANYLKRRYLGLKVAYFHHIPFPSPDIFANLPCGKTLLRALLCFDRLGFQTEGDKQNFIRCIRVAFDRQLTLRRSGCNLSVHFDGSRSSVYASAVGIDSSLFGSLAASSTVTARVGELQANLGSRRVLLSVDRLDYTKGLLQRLSGYRRLLEEHPELHGAITLLQLVIPSREQVQEYEDLKLAIERRVSEINGTFGQPDWVPITYLRRSISCEELVALYRLANVMLVTPMKDGMNLVAKEYCASKVDGSGALVLSQFAGAARELKVGAFLVNPNDPEEVAQACIKALTTRTVELQARMSAMRQVVARHDVWRWFAGVVDHGNVERMPSLIRTDTLLRAETVA